MKKILLSMIVLMSSLTGFSQTITLAGSTYYGTGYCSATDANKTYNLRNTPHNGRNQYEFGFSGQYGVGCSFIMRWNTTAWELVSKEQVSPSEFQYTTLTTLAGNFPTPPCGYGFGGTISGDCTEACSNFMTLGGGGTICIGTSATLTASGCTGTVSWNNGVGIGTSVTVSPTSSTTYTATCSAPDYCIGSVTVNVTAPPTPQISILGTGVINEGDNNYSVCSGTSIQLYCGGCSIIPRTMNWSNGTTSSSNLSAAFTPDVSGSYFATQTIDGCTSLVGNTVNLTLKNKITVEASNNNFCKGTSTTLTASGCTGTITWDNDAGTGASVVVVPPYTMTYTATCSDTQVCNGGITINVTVPAPVAPTITASAMVLCPNTSIILTGNGCTMGNYLWSNGATTNYSINVNTQGSYSLVCSTNLPGCTSPQSSVINITSVGADLTLSGTASSGDRQATQTITSTQSIPANIQTGYYAGKSITLNPTFTVLNGAVFNAEIKTCQ